ncbi:hypothetical protein TNCV_1294901 [Trichonephila clavipes]|nr:hypothetical protein TNCV_1294901 [Trichonephila clavipes]
MQTMGKETRMALDGHKGLTLANRKRISLYEYSKYADVFPKLFLNSDGISEICDYFPKFSSMNKKNYVFIGHAIDLDDGNIDRFSKRA